MPAATPLISVIVATANHAAALARCLAALGAQTAPADTYEVVVVDDGSTDETEQAVRAFSAALRSSGRTGLDVVYCHQGRRRGLATARNRGVRDSRGEIVAFTSDECVPAADWVARLADAWRRVAAAAPPVGGIGGLTAPPDAAVPNLAESYARVHQWRELPRVDAGEVRYLLSTNASYRYEALRTVQGFDTGFPGEGAEDADLGRRLSAAGYRLLFDPALVVRYHGQRSLPGLLRSAYRYGRGAAYHEAKQGGLDKPERSLGAGLARLGFSPLRAALYRKELGLPIGASIGLAVVDGLVAVAGATGRVAEAIDRGAAEEEVAAEQPNTKGGPGATPGGLPGREPPS